MPTAMSPQTNFVKVEMTHVNKFRYKLLSILYYGFIVVVSINAIVFITLFDYEFNLVRLFIILYDHCILFI